MVKFWGDLVTSGVASNDADFNDSWYQGFWRAASTPRWPTPPGARSSCREQPAKTSGKWRAADLPQWDASTTVSSNWGGSTDAVLKLSKNPIAAAQLALYINTNQESALSLRHRTVPVPGHERAS